LSSTGSTGGTNNEGNGVSQGGSQATNNPVSPSKQPTHCDRPGYPSCSNLGTEAGQNAAHGSSCPPGHSKAYCNAYNTATGYLAKKPGLSKQASSTGTNKTGSSTNTSRLASMDSKR
jgi:hypothetical protein